jgi:putative ABC transport system permease protein
MHGVHTSQILMFRNYLITAYRNLLRNRFFTVINVAGLAAGMAACIMIAQYVTFEKSFDRFHEKYEHIYRLVNVRYFPTHKDESAGCVTALGPALKELFPEVQAYTRFYKSDRVFMVPGQKPLRFTNVFSVDSTFLKVFSFNTSDQLSASLLTKPNTAVLTMSAARRLFGTTDAVGQTMLLAAQAPYVVEAVVNDPPANSHIRFDVLLSLVTDFSDPDYCWTCNNRNTYIVLSPHTDAAAFEDNIQRVIQKIHPEETLKREYKLQPLASIHLHSKVRFEHGENGNAKSVMALTAIAALILFIAWLNYINLTTAVAISRSNEVGIRKVNGSTRGNLVVQFLCESLLVNFIALGFALMFAQLMFPFFSSQLGTHTALTLFREPMFWTCIGVALIGGSLIYGFYPAFVISSFKPLDAMKGKSLLPKGSASMRTTLVFIQFTFSIMLLAGTFAVYRQITFMKNLDLGMNIGQTLVIPVSPEYSQREDGFGDDLMTQSAFSSVTYTSEIPGSEIGSVGGGYRPEGVPIENGHQMYCMYVAKNYFEFLSVSLLAGRNFISEATNNTMSTEIIINDAARKALGFTTPDEALGKIIYQNEYVKGQVIGVVKDHHQRSADHPIAPLVFQFSRGKGYYLVKSKPSLLPESIRLAEETYGKHFANTPFEYFFLDDHFNTQYRDFERFGRSFSMFTSLAIFIACLGLSGLTMYLVKTRSKEIALRKVLGASVMNLLMSVSKEYAILFMAAFAIAAPAAVYGIRQWLQGFAYHIEIEWPMLVIPGLVVVAIAWLTVIAQSLKTIRRNPTDSLRRE